MVHFWGSLHQIDFNYSMPENILSEGEINNIEKQIRTFKNSN